MLSLGAPKKLFRDIKEIDGDGKKGDFKQERMFIRVAKTPITNTSEEIVEMDFVDYGDLSTSLRIRDNFRDFHRLLFRNDKERRTNRGNGRGVRFRFG